MLVKVEKLEPCAQLLAMKNGVITVGKRMEVSQKFKIDLPYEPAISFLGINPKELKYGS